MEKAERIICKIFCVLMWGSFLFSVITVKPKDILLFYITWGILMPSVVLPLTVECVWEEVKRRRLSR